MAFNVNLFQGALKFGGARPSLFQVNITNPVNATGDVMVPFMAKTTQTPGSNITPLILKYFGRDVKFAGQRTFEDWTVTIINDEDYAIRDALEDWANSINSGQNNLTKLGSSSPTLYKSDAQVTQFSKTGVPLRVYNFVGIFPTVIAPIDLSWDTADAIEEFAVTFAYDYFEVSGGITGNAGGA
jgi:hypothetical protein|tara:strand:+ start:810 stop:1361 length:552 start_codon:yes stop_codon:yes gene_type:complete